MPALPGDEVVRCGEPPGQPLGGLEGGQRRGVTAARQLKHPADVRIASAGRGLGVSALRVRSARWSQGSASSSRPCQASTAPSAMQATPKAGSSVQPCRSASSTACLPRSAARANDR